MLELYSMQSTVLFFVFRCEIFPNIANPNYAQNENSFNNKHLFLSNQGR